MLLSVAYGTTFYVIICCCKGRKRILGKTLETVYSLPAVRICNSFLVGVNSELSSHLE